MEPLRRLTIQEFGRITVSIVTRWLNEVKLYTLKNAYPLASHSSRMGLPNEVCNAPAKDKKIWKLVLTGGPCGGKTTGLQRLSTFFENLGWKVYRVPETANLLLSGGVNFAELDDAAAERFQENLLLTMMQIEKTFFELAESAKRNCLIICDRGAMDASAFVNRSQWERILARHGLNEVDIRDNRYNQVIHLMTAANGAEAFYTLESHTSRKEDIEEARERDTKAAEAWIGHPYVDIIDNSSDFEGKIKQLISKVCYSVDVSVGDRLSSQSRKVKFLVRGPWSPDSEFPVSFRDFEVTHHYLHTPSRQLQSRLRKRGRKGKWNYTHTARKLVMGQVIEVRTPLSHRDYNTMLDEQVDHSHFPITKTRRAFLYNNNYFQLDIYREPFHERCKGLVFLETYSSLDSSALEQSLPPFLKLAANVTDDSAFSMFNLSLRTDWINNEKFCHKLDKTERNKEHVAVETKKAVDRLKASMRSLPCDEKLGE